MLVTDRARLVELAMVWQGAGHVAGAAAAIAIVAPEPRDDRQPALLSVGYPSDKPLAVTERLNRRPFEEVVHRGRW